MAIKLNNHAFAHAKKLIEQGKIDLHGEWSKHAPTTAQENEYHKSHSPEEYGSWFLGINTDLNKDNKNHYTFPFGNFNTVFRTAIIAAEQRAAQHHHMEVRDAAKQLLKLIDKLQ